MMRTKALALSLLLIFPVPAVGQSLFNAAGMGLPVEALDGRARALGNLGIGLGEAALLPTDPAATARFRRATAVMAAQPSWVDYTQDGGSSGSFQGNRFPLLGLAYPLLSGLMSVQIGSFLDQHFTSQATGTVDFGGTSFETVDVFEQDGAVSNLNVGYARLIGDRTAVGVTVGRYAGSIVRTLTRSFEESVGVEPYVERGKWSYTGHSITAGLSSDVTEGVRVAASIQIPTALDADASEETNGADGSFDLPLQYRLGASARLAPGLSLSASAAYADWSGIADDLLETARAGSASGFGVGIELSRARLFGAEAPIRLGFRRTGLPFSFGDDDASERIFSGGFGLDLNRTNDFRLAGADFALERGRRSGGGVTENFWRATVSLVLSAPN